MTRQAKPLCVAAQPAFSCTFRCFRDDAPDAFSQSYFVTTAAVRVNQEIKLQSMSPQVCVYWGGRAGGGSSIRWLERKTLFYVPDQLKNGLCQIFIEQNNLTLLFGKLIFWLEYNVNALWGFMNVFLNAPVFCSHKFSDTRPFLDIVIPHLVFLTYLVSL